MKTSSDEKLQQVGRFWMGCLVHLFEIQLCYLKVVSLRLATANILHFKFIECLYLVGLFGTPTAYKVLYEPQTQLENSHSPEKIPYKIAIKLDPMQTVTLSDNSSLIVMWTVFKSTKIWILIAFITRKYDFLDFFTYNNLETIHWSPMKVLLENSIFEYFF